MIRIMSARRARQLEAIEQLHDLKFIRPAVDEVIEFLEQEMEDLKACASRAEGAIADPLSRAAYERLRTLRINLKTVQFSIGGGK